MNYKEGDKIKVQPDKIHTYYYYTSDFLKSETFEIVVDGYFSPLPFPENPDDKRNTKVVSCKCISQNIYSLFQFKYDDIQPA